MALELCDIGKVLYGRVPAGVCICVGACGCAGACACARVYLWAGASGRRRIPRDADLGVIQKGIKKM